MPAKGFKGKVAIVTGSSRGIGKATAIELAHRGAKVVLNGRDPDRLTLAVKELRAVTDEVLAIQGNVSQREVARELIERTLGEFGRIDILVNNAALSMRGRFADLNPEVFRSLFEVNVMGTVNCTQEALPHIKQTRGSIVLVSSLAAISGLPLQSAYNASKMALRAIAEALWTEEHGSGIHVGLVRVGISEIAPGKQVLSTDGSMKDMNENLVLKVMSHRKVARAILMNITRRRDRSTLSGIGKLYSFVQTTMPFVVKRLLIYSLRKDLRKIH